MVKCAVLFLEPQRDAWQLHYASRGVHAPHFAAALQLVSHTTQELALNINTMTLQNGSRLAVISRTIEKRTICIAVDAS